MPRAEREYHPKPCRHHGDQTERYASTGECVHCRTEHDRRRRVDEVQRASKAEWRAFLVWWRAQMKPMTRWLRRWQRDDPKHGLFRPPWPDGAPKIPADFDVDRFMESATREYPSATPKRSRRSG